MDFNVNREVRKVIELIDQSARLRRLAWFVAGALSLYPLSALITALSKL